jgi:hypothetical protein
MRKGLQGVAPDGGGQGGALAGALRRVALLTRGPGLVVVISDFREGEARVPNAGADAGATRAAGAPPYRAPGGAAGRLAFPTRGDGGAADRPEWARALAALSGRHDVLAVEVLDRRESALPDVGQITLVDPETGARMEADTSSAQLRRRFEAAELARRDELKRTLRGVRARHVALDTDSDWLRSLGRTLR